MICMVCHDTCQELSKICGCVDSLICKSCLNELNKEKVDKCPICRNTLDISISYNNKTYYKYIFTFVFTLFSMLIIELYPVLHFINIKTGEEESVNELLLYNKSFQTFIVLLCVLFIQPITFFYVINFFKNRNQSRLIPKDGILYIVIISLFHIIYDIGISINIKNNFFLYYFSVIALSCFFFPIGLILIKLLYEYCLNINNIIKTYSEINKIEIKAIIGI